MPKVLALRSDRLGAERCDLGGALMRCAHRQRCEALIRFDRQVDVLKPIAGIALLEGKLRQLNPWLRRRSGCRHLLSAFADAVFEA